jgi:uncharacterized protein (TIGR03435 family)
MTIGAGAVVMTRVRLAQFANLLPRFVNGVVQNETGIDELVDLELRWTPAPGEWVPGGPGSADADPVWPSLSTALSEQLGLRLMGARGDVEYLVIDAAHAPTEN